MAKRGENWRFWLPVAAVVLFAAYTGQKLVRAHLSSVKEPCYDKEEVIPSTRGAIYDRTRDPGTGRPYALVKSVPCWEYRLDPAAMTGTVVRAGKKERPRTREAQARTIAQMLELDYGKVLAMTENRGRGWRNQLLKVSSNMRAHDILCDRRYVAGVIVRDFAVRRHFENRRLSHVLAGIEERYNAELRGVRGFRRGPRDGQGNMIVEKSVTTPPIKGSDVYLTVDHLMQYEVETALKDGVAEFGAASGWCVVLDAKTAEILAMASCPDFDPRFVEKATDDERKNRLIQFNYEPGSVMKVITAACALDCGFARPGTMYSTDRFETDSRGEQKYYKLPGDAGHVWEARMSLRDAIVHSSNIVIGKLAYDIGPKTLCAYMRKFGFGSPTGVELPREEGGLLRNPEKWDKATRSRAGIGQGVSVTALQLASAYQAIANDGVRVPPTLVSQVVNAAGKDVRGSRGGSERILKKSVSRELREMMLGVASREGTARRAAIRGYSVAGKTGTAQKVVGRTYAPGLYRASFCGIVPSGVVRREVTDEEPVPPRVVILVTLDFDEKRQFHQGGNSAAPVFKRIAKAAIRYFEITPDRPDELAGYDDEEFEQMMAEREQKAAEEDPVWEDM